MKKILTILGITAVMFVSAAHAQILYWNTNGTSAGWTNANWGTVPDGPFETAWSASSDVVINATSAATFATTTVGNITVNANTTITRGGTLSSKSGGSVVDVADGVTLTWTSQDRSATASNQNWTKNGLGTWNMGANGNAANTSGTASFTLNSGTVTATGNNSFGGPNSILNINGGLISLGTSATAISNNTINIGGNFGLAGTLNTVFSGSVSLGSSTRTITNTATGSRTFSGNISASSASAGLTLAGTGTTTLGGGNTYTGNTTVEGGQLNLADNAQLRFTIGGNGINNQLINTGGTVSLDGDFVFNLDGASTTLNDSWTLAVGAISYAGSQGTFSVLSTAGAFTETSLGSGVWTREQNGTAYQFSELNSVLSVVPEPSTYALLSLAAAGVGAHIIRRRRR
jgi:autotransporter-associated beta strand protein